MSTSLAGRLISATTTSPYIRQIDNHYHIAMTAESAEQVVEYQRASLRLQAESAAANLRAMGEIARRQDVANDLLWEIADDMSGVREGIEQLNETVESGFALTAERLLEQQQTLLEIAQVLRQPYETQALEIRKQADKWLKSGMRRTGREREDDYTDAMRLLREVTNNPIGNQDYVTWFQIGWLLWQHQAKLGEAEQAFYRAARLSEDGHDFYHILSVRHQSNMQYHQGRYEDAYGTIQKVLNGTCDNDTLFDGARYAAKTGRTTEALRLLEICIDLNPSTYVSMFAEEDFRS